MAGEKEPVQGAADDDFEIEVVEDSEVAPAGDEGGGKTAKGKQAAQADEDEPEDRDDAADGDDDQDEDEDEEQDDQRLRKTRNTNRRLKRKIGLLDRRLADLEAQNAALSQQTGVFGEDILERQIARFDSDLNAAMQARAAALAAQDWQRAAQLGQIEYTILRQKEEAQTRREQVRQRGALPAVAPTDGYRTDLARDWASKHRRWFDPRSNDADSRTVRELSAELEAEGFPVNKPAHFRELELRLKERLPHRFRKAEAARPKPKPAVSGGGEGPGPKRSVQVPKALIDNARAAGLDVKDPKVLRDLAKSYIEMSGRK